MKKFRFRLEPLLRLRRQQEEQKKRAVGVLIREISEQQRQALQMATAVRQEGENLKHQYAQGRVDLDWAGHYRRYVSHMQMAINQRIEAVTQIQQRLQLARQELAEAAKNTKVLDKLKEKRRQRYDHELGREETRELDEVAAQGYVRCGDNF